MHSSLGFYTQHKGWLFQLLSRFMSSPNLAGLKEHKERLGEFQRYEKLIYLQNFCAHFSLPSFRALNCIYGMLTPLLRHNKPLVLSSTITGATQIFYLQKSPNITRVLQLKELEPSVSTICIFNSCLCSRASPVCAVLHHVIIQLHKTESCIFYFSHNFFCNFYKEQ